jgi:hypothetical protein
MKTIAPLSALLCFLLAEPAIATDGGARDPISDEAFYVLSCMEMNGHEADGLCKCSCTLNAIEGQIPYERYSEAALVFAMRQMLPARVFHSKRRRSMGDDSMTYRNLISSCVTGLVLMLLPAAAGAQTSP